MSALVAARTAALLVTAAVLASSVPAPPTVVVAVPAPESANAALDSLARAYNAAFDALKI